MSVSHMRIAPTPEDMAIFERRTNCVLARCKALGVPKLQTVAVLRNMVFDVLDVPMAQRGRP